MANGTFAGSGNQYVAPTNLSLNTIGAAAGFGANGGFGVLNRDIATCTNSPITGNQYGNSTAQGSRGYSYPRPLYSVSSSYDRFFDYCGRTGYHSETIEGTTYDQPNSTWFNAWNTGSRISNSWQTGSASKYGYNSNFGDQTSVGKGFYCYNDVNSGWGSNYPIIMMHPLLQQAQVGSTSAVGTWINEHRFSLRIKYRVRDSSSGSRGSIVMHKIRWNANGSWSWYYPKYFYDTHSYNYGQTVFHQLSSRNMGYYGRNSVSTFLGNWNNTKLLEYPQWMGIQIDSRPNTWFRLRLFSDGSNWNTVDKVQFHDTYLEVDNIENSGTLNNTHMSSIGGHSDYTGLTFSFDCATATNSTSHDDVGYFCDAQLSRWDGYH